MTLPCLPERIIKEAALWYANLLEAENQHQLQQQWQSWLAADPRHQQAWERIEQVRQQVTAVPAKLALPALSTHTTRRRVLRSLVGLSCSSVIGASAYRYVPWQSWHSDYTTAKGAYASHVLVDGSELHLNTNTALDVHINTQQRLLVLHQGQILVQATPHAATQPSPPLRIRTTHGLVQTQAARLILQLHPDHTLLKVLHNHVLVNAHAAPAHTLRLQAGHMLRIETQQLRPPQPLDAGADAWLHGNLHALNLPLHALLHELSRYHRTYLRCDPQIANLKVSGVFPLHDLEQTLVLLREAFGLQQSGFGRYWVRLDATNS